MPVDVYIMTAPRAWCHFFLGALGDIPDKTNKGVFATLAFQRELPRYTFAGVVAGVLLVTMLSAPELQSIVLVLGLCVYGLVYSFWLSGYVLSKDVGTAAMRAVSDPIREGAEGFLKVQYSAVFRMAGLLSILIFLSYYLRPGAEGKEGGAGGVSLLSNGYLGTLCAASFVTGATCSAAAGYLAMWVAARTNIRVSSAARRSYSEALVICFRGGAFSAVLDLTLCVVGVTLLFVTLWILHSTEIGVTLGLIGERTSERLHVTDIPILMVGYGFGASFVALFMQLGGGI